ncbi:hypothetical protein GGF32_010131 [Allomyces javanicus]|nr:hypothetical protein GGF32_010131 [Allomyces javanicus]
MPDTRRLQRELKEAASATAADGSAIKLELVGTDLTHMKGEIAGPAGTPYEGGRFVLDIKIPDTYPFAPPVIKFETSVYHPNVSSQTGAICLDILRNEWTPVLGIAKALLSVQQLLESPEPDDPQDAVVAAHYKRDRGDFERTAAAWTQFYAKTGDAATDVDLNKLGVDAGAVQRLMEMGFAKAVVVRALRQAQGNEDAAVETLLSSM